MVCIIIFCKCSPKTFQWNILIIRLSVQFSSSVMSNSLQPHGLQHARLPCPSPTPGTYSNLCPSHKWCHPTISSSCHSLLLPSSLFPSIRVFSNELVLHIRWPKYWSFSFSISPSNKYSGLTSFKIDWLGRLAVQGTLRVNQSSYILDLRSVSMHKTTCTETVVQFFLTGQVSPRILLSLDFLGNLVVKTPCFHCRAHGFIPSWGPTHGEVRLKQRMLKTKKELSNFWIYNSLKTCFPNLNTPKW